MHSPSSSPDRDFNTYVINNLEDTRELVDLIQEDVSLFSKLTTEWKYWFASHPEHLGEELTASLVHATRMPDVIHFLPDRLK
jgi:hypothetical protein